MDHDAITGAVINEAIALHRELGPGLLESVYEIILASKLASLGYTVERQRPVDIEHSGLLFQAAFRIDLLVEASLLVEIKSVERLNGAHSKQLLTYLRLTKQPVGLLINFGGETLKEGLKRPQQVAMVGAFSAVFNAARGVRLDIKTPDIAFGPVDSLTRKENDDLALLGKADPASLPYIFVMTGLDDPLVLRDNRDFINVAQVMQVRYEYHEVPGKHDWPFWQRSLEAFLRVLSPRLK